MTQAARGLTSYQRDWISIPRYGDTGKANIKCLLKARRIGGSYAVAVDSAFMAAGYEISGGKPTNAEPMNVFIVSATSRQAKEMIQEVREFCEKAAPFDPRFTVDPTVTALTFQATGKRIVALPCSGRSIRGSTGAVVWDECAFAQNPKQVWDALLPISRPNLKNPRGYPVSLITTPWLAGSLVHELFTDKKRPFIRREVDVYTAKAQGFPIDIEELRDEIGIEETFQVEYCLRWLEGGESFFDLAKLNACLTEDLPSELASAPSYYGIDVGLTHDLSAIVEFRHLRNETWVTHVEALPRGTSIEHQTAHFIKKLRTRPFGGVRIDHGMMGAAVYERLAAEFGGRVYRASMLPTEQEAMAVNLRAKIDRRQLRIWTGDDKAQRDQTRAMILELSQIKTKVTDGHRSQISTPRTSAGHCDRAWALLIGMGPFRPERRTKGGPSVHTIDFLSLPVFE